MARVASACEVCAAPSSAGSPQGTTVFAVANMHCGGCMHKVEAALARVPGVISARANLSSKRVTAVHHPGAINTADLVDALAAAGFVAAELTPDSTAGTQAADLHYLRRIGVAGFAAANIMLLSVSVWSSRGAEMVPSVQSLFHWLSALIALPAIAYAGTPFFRSAARALAARSVNMDVPISLGVGLATSMSLYQTIRASEQVYFDAAVTLLLFLLVGRFLDQRMRARASGAAANILGLRGLTACVIAVDGKVVRLTVKSLAAGMRLLISAGERFPVDGRVIEGQSNIDESLITGETRPRAVQPGALVHAGTVNLSASIVIEATATNDNTLLAEIARLMAAAEQARGKYVRLADRAARLYAPAVHTLGLVTFIGWLLAGYDWEHALVAAIAVLIITCPCALALAVPAVQVAATSRLFGRGILVKAPDALERLAEIDTVVFDKTGTLTLGQPVLAERRQIDDATLMRAAQIASASRHPYAQAVVEAAAARGLSIKSAGQVSETPGFGLELAGADGHERLGSAAWCAVEHNGNEASLYYRAADGRNTPFFFEDPLRSDAAQVVAQLRGAGIAVELLSGDRASVVQAAAAAAGITDWAGGALPTDKIERLKKLRTQGAKVLMVGDGLNDAPALAAAHASLSPASAADVSQTAADAIFQGEALRPVLETVAVARVAQRMALQNFGISIAYNLIFVPLAVLGIVTPLLAAIAMSASSIAVTVNAARLRSRRLGTIR